MGKMFYVIKNDLNSVQIECCAKGKSFRNHASKARCSLHLFASCLHPELLFMLISDCKIYIAERFLE